MLQQTRRFNNRSISIFFIYFLFPLIKYLISYCCYFFNKIWEENKREGKTQETKYWSFFNNIDLRTKSWFFFSFSIYFTKIIGWLIVWYFSSLISKPFLSYNNEEQTRIQKYVFNSFCFLYFRITFFFKLRYSSFFFNFLFTPLKGIWQDINEKERNFFFFDF